MEKRKIDFSSLPMPEALSWLMLLINAPEYIGFGWNTKEHRLEYVQLPESKYNEKVAEYIEDKTAKEVVDQGIALREGVVKSYSGVAGQE